MYHTLETINDMHVEITNKCNAACPMCARNNFGGKTRENLILDEWTKEDIDKIFDCKFPNLENVMFCGTHGDPCVAEHSLYAIDKIKNTTDATIEFYSNASMRTTDWWTHLGSFMNQKKPNHWHYRKNDLAIFSIDGLGDTNHLYRRRTNFEKIIENAEAYIKAGGIARWDFIVFKHNEHQVDEAESLAKKMGFKQFRIRKTSRFDYSPDGPNKWRVQDKDGNIEYYLEQPSEKYRNEESKKWEAIEDKKAYFNSTPIDCLYKNNFKRIYVNSFAQIFPCCYISNDVFPAKNSIVKDTKEKVLERWGTTFNSLRYNNWNDILNHEWFATELEASWNKDLNNGKLMRCARTCGKGYSPIKSQSTDTNL
jgi:MoaA/NifB/PqqE/SkfB family radical SAM enzyme